MVFDACQNVRIFPKVCRNGVDSSIRLLLVGLLGVLAYPVPYGIPCVPGKRAFHSEQVICVDCKFRTAIPGLQTRLRRCNRCQHSACLHVLRRKRTDLLNKFFFCHVRLHKKRPGFLRGCAYCSSVFSSMVTSVSAPIFAASVMPSPMI